MLRLQIRSPFPIRQGTIVPGCGVAAAPFSFPSAADFLF
ncbi:hypothetical protein Hsw_1692 [Hymenobacter swuensis DY53]|uniref:Uncharacterized protein n=1 Tax=Hymenobacter swuensis DY53 TaxID=1227739 RepID=W8EZV1_9BACT|nr:hypothetical protein Hsw_1692 [Hymenobacter swuensis DY53]